MCGRRTAGLAALCIFDSAAWRVEGGESTVKKAKPMRNGFPTAVIAAAMAALTAPAVAQAHHVDSGSAVCSLVGNCPDDQGPGVFCGLSRYEQADRRDIDRRRQDG